jgi:phage shock protein E
MNIRTLLCTVTLILCCCLASSAFGGDITWVDVRTADEFRQQHVNGAANIPYEEIDTGVASLGLEKDAVIYLYCGSGRRAGIAKESLDALGYTGVVNVGGLETALAEAGKAKQ